MAAPSPPSSSRRGFLAGAGALAVAAGAAGCGGGADEFAGKDSQNGGDIQIVNFALTLEYLESDFYDQVIQVGLLSGRALDVVKLIAEDERQHIVALRAAARKLKGRPVGKPATDFSSVLQGGSASDVLSTASDLENLGASAYLGAAPDIISAPLMKSALAIHTVEGRHAAAIGHLAGRPFLPDGPLATPLDQDDVLPRIKKFLA